MSSPVRGAQLQDGTRGRTWDHQPGTRSEHFSLLVFCRPKQQKRPFSSVSSQVGWVTVLHLESTDGGPEQGLVGSLGRRLGHHCRDGGRGETETGVKSFLLRCNDLGACSPPMNVTPSLSSIRQITAQGCYPHDGLLPWHSSQENTARGNRGPEQHGHPQGTQASTMLQMDNALWHTCPRAQAQWAGSSSHKAPGTTSSLLLPGLPPHYSAKGGEASSTHATTSTTAGCQCKPPPQVPSVILGKVFPHPVPHVLVHKTGRGTQLAHGWNVQVLTSGLRVRAPHWV